MQIIILVASEKPHRKITHPRPDRTPPQLPPALPAKHLHRPTWREVQGSNTLINITIYDLNLNGYGYRALTEAICLFVVNKGCQKIAGTISLNSSLFALCRGHASSRGTGIHSIKPRSCAFEIAQGSKRYGLPRIFLRKY